MGNKYALPLETSRRLKLVPVSDAFFMEFCVQGWKIPNAENESIECIVGLPEGVVSHGVFEGPNPKTFCILVEHESFDVVPEGMTPPEFCPTMRRSRIEDMCSVCGVPYDDTEIGSSSGMCLDCNESSA